MRLWSLGKALVYCAIASGLNLSLGMFVTLTTHAMQVPSNNTAREHLRRITQTAHVAGTPESLKVAQYVQDELAKALDAPGSGVTVVMDAPKALLASPVSRSVKMRAGGVSFSAPLEEPVLPNDATSDSAWRNMTFNAYSPSGHVEAELVYANYGSPDGRTSPEVYYG